MVQLINIFYVGRLGSELLAGVGLGNMLLNVCIFAISNGMNGTIETFVSWANGRDEFQKCWVHLNQARMIVMVLLAPMVVLFFFVDKILIGVK